MKISGILIAAIWLFFLASAFLQGLSIRHMTFGPPTPVGLFLLFFFFIFSFCAAFFQRRRLMDIWPVRKFVDWRFGAGTYDLFLERLKVMTLFMLVLLVAGTTGLIATYATTQNFGGYFSSSFALVCGFGILGAYLLSLKFPPKLC